MFGMDQDDIIIVPIRMFQRRISGNQDIAVIMLSASSASNIENIKSSLTAMMRERRHIHSGDEDDFNVRDLREVVQTLTSTTKMLTVLLGAVATISLLVGGIGIMNIMLVSVTERTREIGVRMAVGARGSDILLQFLVEAVVLSIGGGLTGIGLGIGVAKIVSARVGWNTLVSPESVVLAFAFSAVIGIFFGFYPARKAAGLDPIEALRYE